MQYEAMDKAILQLLKRTTLLFSPTHSMRLTLPSQLSHWDSDGSKVGDKPSVVPCETKECMYILLCFWMGVLLYSLYFPRVRFKVSSSHQVTQALIFQMDTS